MNSLATRAGAFCILAAAAAFHAAAAAETISLEGARRAALERSRDVLKADIAVRQAEIAEKSAAADFLPSVSGGASWSASLDDGEVVAGDPAASLSASQTLFSGGSRTAALKKARIAAEQAREDLRAARLAVLEEADARFLAAAEARLSYEAAMAASGSAAKQLEIARAKREAGTLSEADFLQTQSTWATKRTAEAQAKWSAETALRSLSSYVGKSAEPAELAGAPYEEAARAVRAGAEGDLEAFAQKLYGLSAAADPSLRKLAAAEEAARLGVDTARAAFFPTLSLSASLGAELSDGSVAAAAPTLKLSASIPLFPFSDRTGALSSAKLDVESATADTAETKEELLLTCYSTTLELLSAADQIASADAALAYAEANHALALEKFKLGAAEASVVADAASTLETARTQGISARFDLYAAVSALARLVGAEDERGLADALR